MKLLKRVAAVLVIFALIFGLVWALVGYFAAPPPSGEAYRLVTDWPKLPGGRTLGQVSGLGVDSRGNVFVFHRAERVWSGEELDLQLIASPTVLVFDGTTGEMLAQWGANTFVMPHGLTIDGQDNLWLTDVGLHQVFKFVHAGKLVMALGERGVPGDDAAHFNQPTDVAVAPDGSFYVSDGYGNSRIVKFSPDGRFLAAWGTKGTAPGQFDTPHSVALDAQGQVFVADRGNARLQIFDSAGTFIAEWKGAQLGRPWAVRIGKDGSVYVVDGGDQPVVFPDRARILKLDASGTVRASFGSYGKEPGQFTWPHTIALGPDGGLYVGEVSTGMRVQKFISSR
jgi:peptidylamidoglycolate lyase